MIRNVLRMLVAMLAIVLPKAPPEPRTVKFSLHPWVKRGHAKLLAGGHGIDLTSMVLRFLRVAAPVAAVVALLLLASATGTHPPAALAGLGLIGLGTTAEEVLVELQGAFTKHQGDLKDAIARQDAEIKANGTASADAAAKVMEALGKIGEVGQALEQIRADLRELETAVARPKNPENPQPKSIGRRFAVSDEVKAAVAGGRFRSDPFAVGSFFAPRDEVISTPSGVPMPVRVPGIVGPPQILTIRDLLNVQPTSTDAIEYVRETGFVNLAAATKENTQALRGSTGLVNKPESSLSFELKSVNVQTIAHWLPATRQVIADAPQLASYVDGRLIYGLKVVEESEILYGVGTSPHLTGITTDPLVQSYKWSDGHAKDTKADAIRRAITKATLAGYPVSGVVVNPLDWEDIELEKDDNGRYTITVLVADGAITRLWRVPVAESLAMIAGDALVGAFGLGATLWDREQASVRISDSHADFFIQNMVAILAEERLALTVYRPEAFVSVDFDHEPGPNS